MSVCVRKWHQNLASKFGLTPHPRGPHTKKILYTQINISDSRLLHFYPAHFFYLSLPNPSVSIHLSLYISICLKRFLFRTTYISIYLFTHHYLSPSLVFAYFASPGGARRAGAAGRGGGQGSLKAKISITRKQPKNFLAQTKQQNFLSMKFYLHPIHTPHNCT